MIDEKWKCKRCKWCMYEIYCMAYKLDECTSKKMVVVGGRPAVPGRDKM